MTDSSIFDEDDYQQIRDVTTSEAAQDILHTLAGTDGMTLNEIAVASDRDVDRVETELRALRRVALTRQTRGPDNLDSTHRLSELGEIIVEMGVEDGVEFLRDQDR